MLGYFLEQRISTIFSRSLFSVPYFDGRSKALITIILVSIFIVIEWVGRKEQYAISKILLIKNNTVRYISYYVIVFTIMIMGNFNDNQFIYFQF